MPEHNRWISVEAAAVVLGISTSTVRRRVKDGSIVARRFGPKLVRIDADQLSESGMSVRRA